MILILASRKRNRELFKSEKILKQFIDKHVENLLQELGDEKSKKIKELENVREELLVQRVSLESFIKFSDTILNKASATDVASVANGLSIRGRKTSNIYKVPRISNSLEMLFSPNDSLISVADEKAESFIGKIIVRGNIVCEYSVYCFSCSIFS